MDITIREAAITDAETISALVSSLAVKHIGPSLGEGGIDVLLAGMGESSTRERIEEGWLHFVAHSGQDLVGVVVVKPPSHLYHLFVQTEFQKKGIGSRLFKHADTQILSATDSPILTVNSSLNAIATYQRFGFVVKGEVCDTNGVRCQAMVRQLDQAQA